MTRLTITSFAFVAFALLVSPTAPAQGFNLIQSDHNRYAQLFKEGKDPDFATSPTWRRLYTNHRWKTFAEGSEFRDPMFPAQTLMGIYLVSHVDSQLTYQIDSIIIAKAALGPILSERLTLDMISNYLDRSQDTELLAKIEAAEGRDANDWYSEMEINRMMFLNRNIDTVIRRRIVSGALISTARLGEVRSFRNLFRQNETDWESTYYHMREKFRLLDALAAYFPFNWSGAEAVAKRAEYVEQLREDPTIRREVEREVREEQAALRTASSGMSSDMMSGMSGMMGMMGMGMSGMGSSTYDPYDSPPYDDGSGFSGGGSMPFDGGMGMSSMGGMAGMMPNFQVGMTEEEIQEEIERQVLDRAEDKMRHIESRYKAFRYIIGVYQSSDYYLEELHTIHRYFQNAANIGDPIAQYHLALFLFHLGDLVDPYTTLVEHRSEAMRLLNRARLSDVTKQRVEELETLLAEAAGKQMRREANFARRLEALIKVEEDKIDLFEDVLISLRQRIANSSSLMGIGGGSGGTGGTSSGSSSSSSGDSGMGGSTSGPTSGGRGSSGSGMGGGRGY
ncbi:MAG: hypothetical protein FWG73_02170 [Planctomycetaceae bacterium]|nr:hypothetical protein [Planctomycetaceae bacterium]